MQGRFLTQLHLSYPPLAMYSYRCNIVHNCKWLQVMDFGEVTQTERLKWAARSAGSPSAGPSLSKIARLHVFVRDIQVRRRVLEWHGRICARMCLASVARIFHTYFPCICVSKYRTSKHMIVRNHNSNKLYPGYVHIIIAFTSLLIFFSPPLVHIQNACTFILIHSHLCIYKTVSLACTQFVNSAVAGYRSIQVISQQSCPFPTSIMGATLRR